MRAGNKKKLEKDERGRRRDAAKRARRLAERNADAMPAAPVASGPRLDRVVDAPLVQPAPNGGIREVIANPYLLRLIVSRLLASMYAASLLGLLWSYITPALRFLVYLGVMGYILKLHAGFPSFAIHLFCGIVFVHYFSETWSGGTRSIWGNRALLLKMRMPREIFPVAAMLVAAYHTFPQIFVLVIFCLVAGWHITWGGIAAFLLGSAILITFSMAMGLLFSALNVFFKDFQNIVATMLQFTHFIVPMMYPFSRVYSGQNSYPILYQIYMANPLTEAILLFQRFFWWDVIPHYKKDGYTLLGSGGGVEFPPDLWTRGLIMLVVCAGFLLLVQRFFARVEGKFPERL